MQRSNYTLFGCHLQGKKDYLDVVHKYFDIHGTVDNKARIPSYVTNHGIVKGTQVHSLLRQSKVRGSAVSLHTSIYPSAIPAGADLSGDRAKVITGSHGGKQPFALNHRPTVYLEFPAQLINMCLDFGLKEAEKPGEKPCRYRKLQTSVLGSRHRFKLPCSVFYLKQLFIHVQKQREKRNLCPILNVVQHLSLRARKEWCQQNRNQTNKIRFVQ